MTTHGNTLFVQTQGAYLGQEGETVRVTVDGESNLPPPLNTDEYRHPSIFVRFNRFFDESGMLRIRTRRPGVGLCSSEDECERAKWSQQCPLPNPCG